MLRGARTEMFRFEKVVMRLSLTQMIEIADRYALNLFTNSISANKLHLHYCIS